MEKLYLNGNTILKWKKDSSLSPLFFDFSIFLFFIWFFYFIIFFGFSILSFFWFFYLFLPFTLLIRELILLAEFDCECIFLSIAISRCSIPQ